MGKSLLESSNHLLMDDPKNVKVRFLNSQNNEIIRKRLYLISKLYMRVNKDMYKRLADK